MHIPDGLMWPPILAAGWFVAILMLVLALRRTSGRIPDEKIPVMAVLAAGIFVAQMLNFPIIGGTTGHLLGAALATVIVGPWAALIVMSIVIIIQGLMFGDGGILSMGLNLTNMAVIGVLVSWVVLRLTSGFRRELSIFVSAWMAVFIPAMLCAAELAVSYAAIPGSYGIVWTLSLPMMAGLHAVIAIGEAIITTGVISYFLRVSPQLVQSFHPKGEVVPQ